MSRHTFDVDRRTIICIDCAKETIGNHNTKRCPDCARKAVNKRRNARRNKHARQSLYPVITEIKTNVTDKQIIAYLRAYAPKAYVDIIRRIEALQTPRAILEKELSK